ncbi:WecB/TagA/CpsF family glycosyltransferase [Litorilituus lipolyticus]|uniref:WecB/TagA/CpsF family glycosyltransferase n=1 Tax=Litorilituus lipolyticus TaxID=2491017 RepID=A0A502KZN6_9GAMM|nr:WecB/TagA/CpsF family glycosyltransferase [Litorilituus lipolyticus]TPH17072.1 WecB/TagA/CpsF family glycosyltransferase [Litorilituus lipolyticus]
MIKPINIANIPVKPYTSFEHVLESIFDEKYKVIPGVAIAINPEKILKSLESDEIKQILLDATIPYADGIGVVKVMEKKSKQKLARIPGSELWLEVLKKASLSGEPIFLLGSKKNIINQCAQKLVDELDSNIVGISDGYFSEQEKLIKEIHFSGASIVIVALGSPKQEVFINHCKKVHPNAFYMGVGGSFDVYVGNVKRAPSFWINLNLEWLYRLLKEPKRFFRQLRLFKFIYMYIFNKI